MLDPHCESRFSTGYRSAIEVTSPPSPAPPNMLLIDWIPTHVPNGLRQEEEAGEDREQEVAHSNDRRAILRDQPCPPRSTMDRPDGGVARLP